MTRRLVDAIATVDSNPNLIRDDQDGVQKNTLKDDVCVPKSELTKMFIDVKGD